MKFSAKAAVVVLVLLISTACTYEATPDEVQQVMSLITPTAPEPPQITEPECVKSDTCFYKAPTTPDAASTPCAVGDNVGFRVAVAVGDPLTDYLRSPERTQALESLYRSVSSDIVTAVDSGKLIPNDNEEEGDMRYIGIYDPAASVYVAVLVEQGCRTFGVGGRIIVVADQDETSDRNVMINEPFADGDIWRSWAGQKVTDLPGAAAVYKEGVVKTPAEAKALDQKAQNGVLYAMGVFFGPDWQPHN